MTNSFEARSLPLQTLPSLCHNDVVHLQLPDLLFRFQQVSAASHVFTLDFQGQIMTGILIVRSIQALTLLPFVSSEDCVSIYPCAATFYHFHVLFDVAPLVIWFFLWRFYAIKLGRKPTFSKQVSQQFAVFFMPYLFSVTLLHDFVMVSPLFVDRQKLDHRKRTHQHLIVGKTCYTWSNLDHRKRTPQYLKVVGKKTCYTWSNFC